MAKSHSSCRSAAEWVTWAQSEGMFDLVESEEDPGIYVFLVHIYKFWCFLRQSILPLVCQDIGAKQFVIEATLLWSQGQKIWRIRLK